MLEFVFLSTVARVQKKGLKVLSIEGSPMNDNEKYFGRKIKLQYMVSRVEI